MKPVSPVKRDPMSFRSSQTLPSLLHPCLATNHGSRRKHQVSFLCRCVRLACLANVDTVGKILACRHFALQANSFAAWEQNAFYGISYDLSGLAHNLLTLRFTGNEIDGLKNPSF